jgi:hypothetical protein
MKDLYENVLIGEFIFRLGYKMGEHGKLEHENISLNLLQQTPLDKLWGDYMARVKTRGFLVEFKRAFSERDDERKKLKYQLLKAPSTLRDLAHKCQFFGYSKQHSDKRGRSDIIFCRYLDAVSDKKEVEFERWGMDNFLKRILEDKIGGTAQQFTEYITRMLRRLIAYYKKIPGTDTEEHKKVEALIKAGESAVAIISTENEFIIVPVPSMLHWGLIVNRKAAEDAQGGSGGNITFERLLDMYQEIPPHGYVPFPGYNPSRGYDPRVHDPSRDKGRESPGHER